MHLKKIDISACHRKKLGYEEFVGFFFGALILTKQNNTHKRRIKVNYCKLIGIMRNKIEIENISFY